MAAEDQRFTVIDGRCRVPEDVWVDIIRRAARNEPKSAIRFACSSRFFRGLDIHQVKSELSLSHLYPQLAGLEKKRLTSIIRLVNKTDNLDARILIGTRSCWYTGHLRSGIVQLGSGIVRHHPQAIYNANISATLLGRGRVHPLVDMASFMHDGANEGLLVECHRNLRKMISSYALWRADSNPTYMCYERGYGHNFNIEQHPDITVTCAKCVSDAESYLIRRCV